jgi:hypothetical protein
VLLNFINDSISLALRMTTLITAVAISIFVTTSFLCAAVFVFVLQSFGLVFACLSGAGVFFVITLIAVGCYLHQQRQSKKRLANGAKFAFAAAMSDPMIVAAGLQIVRAVGVKRLLPLFAIGFAIGAIAFGLMTSRKSSEDNPAE